MNPARDGGPVPYLVFNMVAVGADAVAFHWSVILAQL
jgi:hypothetical protein